MLLPFAAAVACGGDSSTVPSASVAGTYTLQTVNSSGLPFVAMQAGANTFEILTDTITLNDGGMYTEGGTNRTTANGQVTTSTFAYTGTYSLKGTAITLINNQNLTEGGSVGRDSLIITGERLRAVYTK